MTTYTQFSKVDIQHCNTVKDCIQFAANWFESENLFFGHGTDNAMDEAAVLLLWGLQKPWNELENIYQQNLSAAEKSSLHQIFEQRALKRIPAAYITGQAWFAGLMFIVNNNVLVPRSPIAELIQHQFMPWLQQEPVRILDLCTGSGCIGLACAYVFKTTKIDLVDISVDALDIAKKNIELHAQTDVSIAHRVNTIESDGLNNVVHQYDLIVSNPPYVDAADLSSMPDEYRAEPELGLASGTDGLAFTRKLLAKAAHFLTSKGVLIVEVGNSGEGLQQQFPMVPFTWIEFEHGGHGVFVLSQAQLLESAGHFL